MGKVGRKFQVSDSVVGFFRDEPLSFGFKPQTNDVFLA
jgi:hypothetical protein